MIRYAVLSLAVLTLADTAKAQLTEFEGRVVSVALLSRVYQDARAAIALADTSEAWPSSTALPFGSRLTFAAEPGGAWEVGFEALPFETSPLRFGPTSGVLRIPAESGDTCQIIYEGSVRSGRGDWEERTDLDLSGTSASFQSCRLEAAV